MIAAVRLSRRYGTRVAVDDVSFDVGRGEIVALVGPNGAGKTSTIRMLAGLIAPTAGRVLIDGAPLTAANAGAARSRIGFLTEAPGLWDRLTVRENLRVHAGLHELGDPDGAVDRALELLGLGGRAATRAAELSKGLRQKVAIARTLLHDPSILLLDEPTSGLDPQVARDVRDLLLDRRANGCAILVSTHNLGEVDRIANRVAVLRTRLLAFDRPEALRAKITGTTVTVRLVGTAAPFGEVMRAFDPGAGIDGSTLTASLADPVRQTPLLIRALVAAGAEILEVAPATPDLEDVYLRVVGDSRPQNGNPS